MRRTKYDQGVSHGRSAHPWPGRDFLDTTPAVSYTHLDVYKRQELDLTSFEIPTQSILNLLREVLAVEHPEGLDVKVEEDTVIASGSIMIASYEITFQKETMAIEKVTVPSADAELLASNFTFLESSTSS